MIDVHDLVYRYKGNSDNTIHGISFQVEKGEIFGFLGPSGAGKSTTQKILTGLNTGYSGSVKVGGSELSAMGREYYENIGVSFELPNLYTRFTARENLKFFSSFYKETCADVDELLDSVGLLEDADRKVETYSKGMKMRLNFIRAFLNNPSLVFLDEPTSGLDPVNRALIQEIILKKKCEGAAVFLTTHNMSVAADICDRVAFIVDGELKIVDTPGSLMYQFGKREVVVDYFADGSTSKKSFNLESLKTSSEFMSIVKNREIKSIHTKDATLDDIFIQVTGRSLT